MIRSTKDLTRGPVFKTMIRFTVPIILTNFLQHLYTTADTVAVGQFVGKHALAAVGSTTYVTGLLINLFVGLAAGANAVFAQYYGAGERDRLHRAVSTSLITGLVAGLFLVIVGTVFTEPILRLICVPEDIMEDAALYVRIFFSGVPFSLLYNFGAGLLRAMGDTKRPMAILSLSGLVNVGVNLLLVAVFHFGVAGVAVATVVSQVLSCAAVLVILFHPRGEIMMTLREMRFYFEELRAICRIGIPTGLNSVLFTLTNTLIQSNVNSFGSELIAANTAAQNLDGFIYLAFNAFSISVTSFVGQNYGAKKYRRIDRGTVTAIFSGMAFSFSLALVIVLFPAFFIGLFNPDPSVVTLAKPRLLIVGLMYFLYTPAEVLMGSMRGMGESLRPFIVNIACVCGIRIMWICTVFRALGTQESLYFAYPVSWIFISIATVILFFMARKKRYEFPLPPDPAE